MSDCCDNDKEKDEAPVSGACGNGDKKVEPPVGETDCCSVPPAKDCCSPDPVDDCCASPPSKDRLLWGSLAIVVVALLLSFIPATLVSLPASVIEFCKSVKELALQMWWGVALGIIAVAVLHFVPQRTIEKWLGRKSNFSGLLRAVAAGLLLDVCSHGVLLVSMQLYRKGLSIGQTMAFLIASPWNSFSLTIVLVSLIGWKWTLVFIGLSAVIALLTGILFSVLEKKGLIPTNPNGLDMANDTDEKGFWEGLSPMLKSAAGWWKIIKLAFSESRMIIRWILFGIVLASLIRVLLDPNVFANWFGPSLAGLALTLIAATLIEVCSEGSSPLAADLLNRAAAPGNSFTFLMAGVATDYTEIMSVKETTRSWKIAWFLPALTIPQIVLIGWLLNRGAG